MDNLYNSTEKLRYTQADDDGREYRYILKYTHAQSSIIDSAQRQLRVSSRPLMKIRFYHLSVSYRGAVSTGRRNTFNSLSLHRLLAARSGRWLRRKFDTELRSATSQPYGNYRIGEVYGG